jgi:hypothetical protein
MPLKKLTLKAGVNRENTRYTNEGGYYESDKVRFRQGTPEKIGGWQRISSNTFLGVCRSLWNWITLLGRNYLGVGTNLKYYVENGGVYYDITPLRTVDTTGTLTNPFTTNLGTPTSVEVASAAHGLYIGDVVVFSGSTAVGGIPAAELNTRHVVATVPTSGTYTIVVTTAATSVATGGGTVAFTYYSYTQTLTNPFTTNLVTPTLVLVTDVANGVSVGDFVTFSNASPVGGVTIVGEYTVTSIVDNDNYYITSAVPAVSVATGGGTVYVQYQIPVGSEIQVPTEGWGIGSWGLGTWGIGDPLSANIRLWTATNFGENLIYAPRGGPLYYWQAIADGLSGRGKAVKTLLGASNVPLAVNTFIVSDASRFVIVFGTNDIYSTVFDPMLIRWSDQESVTEWTPAATNQAGSLRLSHGSTIVSVLQSRQEILVWTDSTLYSLQYLGAPFVWASQLLGDNVSIAGPNAAALASGVTYWMGVDKFYMYDGTVKTLRCDLRQFIYSDINISQFSQVFASTNEGFNEVWFFYCSSESFTVDRYVVYNYAEDVWYYGTMARSAWLDTGLREYPLAATYAYNIVNHELGVDDGMLEAPLPIAATITTSQFDIDDGHNFAFAYRLLPDLTFRGSTDGSTPSLTMQLLPLKNSGSGYNNPKSVGGTNFDAEEAVTATQTYPVDLDTYNGQIFIRVRGRQMAMRISSNQLGTQWQLGSPRIDLRPDGRR